MINSVLYCVDLGGSTIDMVAFSRTQKKILECKSLESRDFPEKKLPEILKAFGVFFKVQNTKKLHITGGHSALFSEKFFLEKEEIALIQISEFEAIAKGGAFLSEENSGLIISLGTGTAMVSVTDMKKNEWEHVGGSGIGGGTFLGLGKAILGIENFSALQKISEQGDLSSLDISVGEIIGGGCGNLTPEMTASNFGKFSEKSSPADISLGIANLVGQSIASLAVEKAKNYGHQKIILGGKISRFPVVINCIKKTAEIFHMEIIVPNNSGFMTAVGAGV